MTTDTPDTKMIPSPPEQEDAFAPAHEVTAPNSSTGLFELADRVMAWRGYKSTLAALTKDANEVIAKIEATLVDRMIAEEATFNRGGHNFHTKITTRASCKVGFKDDLIEWLGENGHGSLVGTAINANTLASFINELMSDDDNPTGELPEGLGDLVNVYRTPALAVAKSSK